MLEFFKSIGRAILSYAIDKPIQFAFRAATVITGVKGFLQAKEMLAKGQDIMANKTAAGGKIPVIYGTRRVGAQIVYMDTAQNRSKDLFVVYAISVGECEEILGRTIEIDGNSILDGNIYKGGGYVGSDKISSGSGSLNTASQVGDNQYSNAGTLGTDPTLRYSFVFNLHHGASSQTADPMLRASIPTEWTTNHKLNGICYIAASFDYDKKGMYKGVPQITVQVKGKKVYDPRTDTTAWSSNPALCFLDYIQNDEYGKGLATSQINMTTISSAANKCDTLVDQPYYNGNYQDVTWSGDSGDDFIVIDDNADWWQNKVDEVIDIRDASDTVIFDGVDIKGTTRYEFYDATQENRLYIDGTLSSSYTNEAGSAKAKVKRFHCNGYIDTNKNVMDNAKELLANMRGILNYVNGKYELEIEDTGTSTFSITDDHIIADTGISVDYGNKDKKANKVVIEFFNANKKYELDTATVLHDASPEYYSDDGEVLEIKAEFPYVTDPYIAYNMGKAILTRSRNQTTMQFLGTPEMYKLNVGDIVDLTYSGLGFSGKVCRVEALELQANGLVSVSLIEYFDVYTWEVPAQESTEILAKIPTIGALKPPQASSIVFTDTDASSINRPTLTWTEPTDFPVRQYRVDVVDSSDNNVFSKIVDTPSVDLAFLPKAADYEASVTAFNGVGIESNASTKTFTIADDPVKTTEVEMNGVTLSTVETYGTVSGKTGNWVKFLNKTNFAEVVEFDNGLIVDSGTAQFENSATFADGFTGQGIFDVGQGAIEFSSYTPATTTDRLYNVSGSLYWNGQALGTGTGDITAVVAGTNLNGGGTSGSVTLNLDSTITGDHTFSDNVIISGDLTVNGTTTTVNTNDLNVKDKNITLNYSTGDSSASANGAGITIQDAVSATEDATLTWNTANNSFNFSHDLNFADNVKAQFGAGDLQIYHDGLNSHIKDTGTGDLLIEGSDNIWLMQSGGNKVFLNTIDSSAINLYFNNSKKLETTNTGVLVTGTVTSDGLTVQTAQGDIKITNSASQIDMQRAGTNYIYASNASGSLRLGSGGSLSRLNIANNGDISFYDDTGSSQAFFWDASAEKLAIGTTTANAALTVNHALPTGQSIAEFRSTGNSHATIDLRADGTGDPRIFFDLNGATPFAIGVDNSDGDKFKISGNYQLGTNDRFAIDSSGNSTFTGNVTLSSTAPLLYLANTTSGTGKTWRFSSASNGKLYITQEGVIDAVTLDHTTGNATFAGTVTGDGLTVAGSNANLILGTTGNDITFTRNGDNYIYAIGGTSSNIIINPQNRFVVNTGGSERARIDSSGRLGLGDTAPQDYLEINGSGKGLGGLTISNSTHNHAALSFARSSTATARIYLTEPDATHTGQLNFQTSNASGGSPNLVTGMVIDENQRVGIQITSPEGQLHINTESAEATKVYIDGEVNQQKSLEIRHYDASEGSGAGRNLFYLKTPASNRLDIGGFTNGSSEYQIMTLLESGEVIVGGTTAGQSSAATIYPTGNITSGSITATGSGEFNFNKTETYNPVITANDSESDTGQIIALQLGGTTKGVIGIGSANGSDTYIASGTTSSAGFGLRFIDYTVTNAALPCRGDGSTVDDTMDLGNSGARFDDIYATNGTINTSDRNDKQDIQALTDAEQRVATACKGLIRRFKWQSAVTQKGDDARYHFGIMAQDLQDAFTAEGLDAGDYGMFISSTWTDDKGNEQTRLGVRYNELLAFIIATL